MVTPLRVTSSRWGVRPHGTFLSFHSTISQPSDLLPLLRSVVHQGRKTLKAATTISTRHFHQRFELWPNIYPCISFDFAPRHLLVSLPTSTCTVVASTQCNPSKHPQNTQYLGTYCGLRRCTGSACTVHSQLNPICPWNSKPVSRTLEVIVRKYSINKHCGQLLLFKQENHIYTKLQHSCVLRTNVPTK